jgi:hypothetical protein
LQENGAPVDTGADLVGANHDETLRNVVHAVGGLRGEVRQVLRVVDEERIARRDVDQFIMQQVMKSKPSQAPDSEPPIRVEIPMKRKAGFAAVLAGVVLAVLKVLNDTGVLGP